MASSDDRQRTDKDVQAMASNLKEQRLLQKSLHTLKLEEAYALKLIHLNDRQVKLAQSRLRNKVFKVKSNLTADEIAELTTLDLQGKLGKDYTSIQVNSAIRISAAAKRLKLQPTRVRGSSARSYFSSPKSREEEDGTSQYLTVPKSRQFRATSAKQLNCGISESPGTEISIPVPLMRKYDSMRSLHVSDESKNNVVSGNGANQVNVVRPCTSIGIRPKSAMPDSIARPKTAPGQNPNALCVPKGNSGRKVSNSPRPSCAILDLSFGSDRTPMKAAQFRQQLLEEELIRAYNLENRKKQFLIKTAEWLEDSRSVDVDSSDMTAVVANIARVGSSETAQDDQPGATNPRRPKTVGIGSRRRDIERETPEEKYKRQIREAWKDLNKCRYLRVSPDQQDLSGVNTLAKDQYRLFQVLRQTGRPM